MGQWHQPGFVEAVGSRIKKVRIRVFGERGKGACAAAMNSNQITYVQYENGARLPPIDWLDKFSLLTGAPLLWLVRGTPENFSVDELEPIIQETTRTFEQIQASVNAQYIEENRKYSQTGDEGDED